ncbi:MAG TPA: S41 family peptidase [Xanthobacteraceae bacterium]|nr:S41 family peptidase [Xanthobacteraceae bacterium]
MHRFHWIMIGAAAGAALVFVTVSPPLAPLINIAIASPSTAAASTYRELELFGKVFDTVRQDYVDKPDSTKLIQSAITGMVSSLDPHSSYMNAQAYQEMQVETTGEFGGLGMQITKENNVVKVVSPIDDTPASKAGILSGDIITQINGKAIEDLPLDSVVDKLRGEPGSKVTLAIQRANATRPVILTLTREIIKTRPVSVRDEGGDVGYIRITEFNEQATDELKNAIKKLQAKIPADRMKGYILDLRNNPGGLLDQAIGVVNTFVSRGEIVSTRSRDPNEDDRFFAKPKLGDLTNGKPLIVLINGGSASASEIVAGALQDQKRATILGTRSFGKGSVQTIIPLGSDNGALRLTTARYYTPSGRSIQAQGITPDIQVVQQVPKNLQANQVEVSEASLPGHFRAQGKEEKGSQSYVPAKPQDDAALQTALALLRGTETNLAFPPRSEQEMAPQVRGKP